MEASKWLQIQALLDSKEMMQLLDELGPIRIFRTGEVIDKGKAEISKQEFVRIYEEHLAPLQLGEYPASLQLSVAITTTDQMVKIIPISEQQEMVRATHPVIQLQMHRMGYSPLDGKFRPMVLGKDSISWGVQFSYPQLFQDGGDAVKVDESENFPNTTLFRNLQRWIRKNSVPTPFEVDGKKVNVPIRLGKKCFPWINKHPQLIEQQIRVVWI